MTTDFVIRHLSTRYNGTLSQTEHTSVYMKFNLVFEARDPYLYNWCKKESEDYQEVVVVTSREEHDRYIESLELTVDDGKLIVYSNPTYEQVHRKELTYNSEHLLQYIEKFDVFRYYSFIESTPTTEGALKELRQLSDTGFSYSHFTDSASLIRILKTLDLHWH